MLALNTTFYAFRFRRKLFPFRNLATWFIFTKMSSRQIFNVKSHVERELNWVGKGSRRWKWMEEDKEEWLGPLNWKSHVFLKMMNGPSVRVEGNEMRDESPEIEELHVINARSSGNRLKFFSLIEINFTSHS